MNIHQDCLAGFCLRLAATPAAAGIGRCLIKHTLGLWGLKHLTDPATLIASELLANAVTATSTTPTPDCPLPLVAIQTRVARRSLLVEVWDNSPEKPTARTFDNDAEGGRGLFLVDAISERWGVWLPGTGGKIVYAELDIGQPPTPTPGPTPLPQHIRAAAQTGTGQQHTMADLALSRARTALLHDTPVENTVSSAAAST